jgi:hypothetical protein
VSIFSRSKRAWRSCCEVKVVMSQENSNAR